MRQIFIRAVYSKFPEVGGVRHRIHPTVALVLQEWYLASQTKRDPNLGQITVKAINKACINTESNFPDWPAPLYSTDLSQYASEQPADKQWWVPVEDSENDDNGAPLFHSY
jgi:hypothetical protein